MSEKSTHLGKRILILGCSGSGKSTLAKELAQRLHLSVFFIDQLIWQPGWKMLPDEELNQKIGKLLSTEEWIVDGMLLRHTPQAAAMADTIVFLDFPRWLCLRSVLKRQFLSYGRARPEMHPDCPEHFDWEFLVWIWRWQKRNRPGVVSAFGGQTSTQVLVQLKSRKELERWLRIL